MPSIIGTTIWDDNVNISRDRIVLYSTPETRTSKRRLSSGVSISGLATKLDSYSLINGLSRKAQRRISDYTNILVDSSKWKTVYDSKTKATFRFKINFITLTLSSRQIHTDAEIYKFVLKPFLRVLRNRYPNLMYLWKAETQDNGNVHYHLTTNTYIYWEQLRNLWNYCQEKLGYVSRSGLDKPNSTDVHATKGVRNLAAYLCKYYTKADLYTKVLIRYFRRYGKQLKDCSAETCELPRNYFSRLKRKIKGVIWNCSKALKVGKLRVINPSKEVNLEIDFLRKRAKFISYLDYSIVIYLNNENFKECKSINLLYQNFIAQIKSKNKEEFINLLN